MGYAEFELDIPEVMRRELPYCFDGLAADALTEDAISLIPPNAQGAYMLFYAGTLVYVGKTDAQAGFRNRLMRHFFNVQHRSNLDASRVSFKAVRIFVFSNFDLETMLIEEYEKRGGRPAWNFSGFGSNDPGRNRENQLVAKFDLDYPIDIDKPVEIRPGEYKLADLAASLKDALPYLFRYDTNKRHYRQGHFDMDGQVVNVSEGAHTTRSILAVILHALPIGWQVTVLPNRVILYKEDKEYGQQIERIKRA